MILGGVGGGSTTTGNVFEKSSNIFKSLSQRNEFDKKNGKLLFENEVIAEEYNQHNFYTYLTNKGIDWKKIVSKNFFQTMLL